MFTATLCKTEKKKGVALLINLVREKYQTLFL